MHEACIVCQSLPNNVPKSSATCVQDYTTIVEAVLFDKACEAPNGNLRLGVEQVVAGLEKNYPELLGTIENLHDTFGTTTSTGMLKRVGRLVTKHKHLSKARFALNARARKLIEQTQLHGVAEGMRLWSYFLKSANTIANKAGIAGTKGLLTKKVGELAIVVEQLELLSSAEPSPAAGEPLAPSATPWSGAVRQWRSASTQTAASELDGARRPPGLERGGAGGGGRGGARYRAPRRRQCVSW